MNIQIPEVFSELFNPKYRHVVYYGGRASGKSTAVATALLVLGLQERHLVLCTREYQNSLNDSVYKLLKSLIEKYELKSYEVLRDTIRNRETGTEFIFKGLKSDVNAIKSIEGITIAWVEEAQSISKESIDVLVPTVRKKGSRLFWTFNRWRELDPVYVEFCTDKRDDTFVKQVNSDVLEELGLLPDVMIAEREKMRERDPALFSHIWLGQPLSQADKAIIRRDDVIRAFDNSIEEPEGAIEFGVDVARFGSDRTVIVKRQGVKVLEIKTLNKSSITDIYNHLKIMANDDEKIKVDDTGVGGGLTDLLRDNGYNVVPVNFGAKSSEPDKYPNLISEAWFYLASEVKKLDLPEDSDLLMELTTREWKMDSRGRRAVEGKGDYKRKGFRSPDLADALILAFFTPETRHIHYATADDLL